MWAALFHKFSFFAAVGDACTPSAGNSFFGFPVWWEYITTGEEDYIGKCTPKPDFPDGIWAIAFAIVDMLLYLAGIVAVVMIIVAGVSYITAAGNVEKTTSARRRIINSLIGLAIVLIASVFVAFVGNSIVG